MAIHANPEFINGLDVARDDTVKAKLNQLFANARASVVKAAQDHTKHAKASKDARLLRSMDERLLKDVGIERQDIDRIVHGNPMHLHY